MLHRSSHRPHRALTLAVAGLLTVGLTACGGDDEAPAGTTAPTTSAPTAALPDADAETSAPGGALDDATETTEDASASEDAGAATEDPTAGSGTADGVPELADIWPIVLDNAENAEALDMTMQMEDAAMGGSMDAHLRGQLDDSNYEAHVTMDGMEASIVMVDAVHYVRGNEAFWTDSGAPNATELADVWVSVPEEMGFADSFSMSQMWEDFFATVPTDPADLQTTSADLVDLDGEQAYHYVLETEGAEVWISADGEDQLRKVDFSDESMADGGAMTIEVKDWNNVDPIEAPEDSTPIEELLGGAGN